MDQDARHSGEMHHRVEGGHALARLQLVEIRVGRHDVEHLAGLRDVGGQIVDAGMVERFQIDIDDPVAAVEQIRDDVLAGLAGSPGKQNAFFHGLVARFDALPMFSSTSCYDKWCCWPALRSQKASAGKFHV